MLVGNDVAINDRYQDVYSEEINKENDFKEDVPRYEIIRYKRLLS